VEINFTEFNIGTADKIFVIPRMKVADASATADGPTVNANKPKPFKKGNAIFEIVWAVVINLTGFNIGTADNNFVVARICTDESMAIAEGPKVNANKPKPFKKGHAILEIVCAVVISLTGFNIGTADKILATPRIYKDDPMASKAGAPTIANNPKPFKKGNAIFEIVWAVVINLTGFNIGTADKILVVPSMKLADTIERAAGPVTKANIPKPFKKGHAILEIV
jgi:hypothetical protein